MKKENKVLKRGYSYHYSDESIKKYMKLPHKNKLNWLEEINEFLYKVMPEENREIWRKFRTGEL